MADGSFQTDWQMGWLVSALEVSPASPWEVPVLRTGPGSGTEPGVRSEPEAAQTEAEPGPGAR